WVRRGGRLVISASAAGHAQDRAALLEKLGLLDCALLPGEVLDWPGGLGAVSGWVVSGPGGGKPLDFRPGRDGKLETAVLQIGTKPERRVDVLVEQVNPAKGAAAGPRPLIVQGPSGLGRVLLTAFDLDAAPFTDWEGREAFFRRLHQAVGPRADG